MALCVFSILRCDALNLMGSGSTKAQVTDLCVLDTISTYGFCDSMENCIELLDNQPFHFDPDHSWLRVTNGLN